MRFKTLDAASTAYQHLNAQHAVLLRQKRPWVAPPVAQAFRTLHEAKTAYAALEATHAALASGDEPDPETEEPLRCPHCGEPLPTKTDDDEQS